MWKMRWSVDGEKELASKEGQMEEGFQDWYNGGRSRASGRLRDLKR